MSRTTEPGTRPVEHAGTAGRRGAKLRAEICRRRAVNAGLRTALALIDAIGHYQQITDRRRPGELPNPKQTTLAKSIGTCERTVRRQLVDLERAGIVQRFTPRPVHQRDGTWTRASTRYLLLDRRRARAKPAPATTKDQVAPTGHSCPVSFQIKDSGARSGAPPDVERVDEARARAEMRRVLDEVRAKRRPMP